jgi:hypothetical protein
MGALRTGGVALAALATFGVTLQVSLAEVFRSTSPQLALKVAPLNAGARAKLAALLVASPATRSAARALALDAIQRDPIQPVALRVLAVALDENDARLDEVRRGLMAQAQRLTRRDLATQMWFIDQSIRKSDALSTMHHFDLALRSSESAREGIFPLLEVAASDREVRQILLRTLGQRPSWAKQFASYSVGSGRDLAFSAEVAGLLLDPRDPEDRQQYLFLTNRLVQDGRYALAWDIYRKRGLAPANIITNGVRHGDFDAPENGSPFDWTFAQEPELWASRERGSDNAGFVLRVAAFNGRSGEVAWQVVHLPPGAHRLQVQMGDIPTAAPDRPEVRMECAAAAGGERLATVIPDQSGPASREFSAEFTVPQSCPFQRISIRAAGQGPLKDPVPWVDDVRID